MNEQAERERSPFYVPNRDIEARIVDVKYKTSDYGNGTECRISFDNGYDVLAMVTRDRDDIAETAAYNKTLDAARLMFEWRLAEHMKWVQAQERQAGMLAALGVQGGD